MYHDILYTVSMKTQNLVQNSSSQKPYIPDVEGNQQPYIINILRKKKLQVKCD